MARTGTSFRDLTVWQRAMDLTVGVYALSEGFPKREMYGLTNQMRRCSASVPANSAEGQGRRGYGDCLRFLCIAAGSLAELETFLEPSRRLTHASEPGLEQVEAGAEEVGKMLQGLIGTVGDSVCR